MKDWTYDTAKLLVVVRIGAVGSPATSCKQLHRKSVVPWHSLLHFRRAVDQGWREYLKLGILRGITSQKHGIYESLQFFQERAFVPLSWWASYRYV